jgi:hypothetical protein
MEERVGGSSGSRTQREGSTGIPAGQFVSDSFAMTASEKLLLLADHSEWFKSMQERLSGGFLVQLVLSSCSHVAAYGFEQRPRFLTGCRAPFGNPGASLGHEDKTKQL